MIHMNNLKCAYETEIINPKNKPIVERMGISNVKNSMKWTRTNVGL